VLWVALAALGLACGLSWRLPGVAAIEDRAALTCNRMRLPDWVDRVLLAARPLGTKWVWIAALAALALAWPDSLPWLAGGAALAALAERMVKRGLRRPRPFVRMPEIQLRQLPPPGDPSFPSGDAMRVWFLVCALGAALPNGLVLAKAPVWAAAGLVSLGRVRLGAHYPLDVWAGAWMGVGFAAAASALAA
jgi:undecaprenyl-diphosphatase